MRDTRSTQSRRRSGPVEKATTPGSWGVTSARDARFRRPFIVIAAAIVLVEASAGCRGKAALPAARIAHLTSGGAAASLQFRMTAIGSSADEWIDASDINNKGVVVGTVFKHGMSTQDQVSHAFLKYDDEHELVELEVPA